MTPSQLAVVFEVKAGDGEELAMTHDQSRTNPDLTTEPSVD